MTRARVEELLAEIDNARQVFGETIPWLNNLTQEQIDRAEAVAMNALGAQIHQPLGGGQVTIAILAVLANQAWIFGNRARVKLADIDPGSYSRPCVHGRRLASCPGCVEDPQPRNDDSQEGQAV